MSTLFSFFTLLVPCMSLYNDYDEIGYKIRRNPVVRKPFRGVLPLRERKYDFPVRPVRYAPDSFAQWLRVKSRRFSTTPPDDPNLDTTFFPTMENMQEQATKISESTYPWIARVIHSPDRDVPFLCTAACIEERIFITAARCLYAAKVVLTSVLYRNERIRPVATILPSDKTKQLFDDIGFIIANRNYTGSWEAAKLYGELQPLQRTDDKFKWFEKMGWLTGTAIGHVVDIDAPTIQPIYEVKVHMGIYLCNWLYGFGTEQVKPDYFVPCYHTCTLEEHMMRKKECSKYLAGEGHIVLEETTKDIIGIATWAGLYGDPTVHLPVGMSVVGSNAFREDLKCAREVRKAPESTEYYDSLCMDFRMKKIGRRRIRW